MASEAFISAVSRTFESEREQKLQAMNQIGQIWSALPLQLSGIYTSYYEGRVEEAENRFNELNGQFDELVSALQQAPELLEGTNGEYYDKLLNELADVLEDPSFESNPLKWNRLATQFGENVPTLVEGLDESTLTGVVAGTEIAATRSTERRALDNDFVNNLESLVIGNATKLADVLPADEFQSLMGEFQQVKQNYRNNNGSLTNRDRDLAAGLEVSVYNAIGDEARLSRTLEAYRPLTSGYQQTLANIQTNADFDEGTQARAGNLLTQLTSLSAGPSADSDYINTLGEVADFIAMASGEESSREQADQFVQTYTAQMESPGLTAEEKEQLMSSVSQQTLFAKASPEVQELFFATGGVVNPQAEDAAALEEINRANSTNSSAFIESPRAMEIFASGRPGVEPTRESIDRYFEQSNITARAIDVSQAGASIARAFPAADINAAIEGNAPAGSPLRGMDATILNIAFDERQVIDMQNSESYIALAYQELDGRTFLTPDERDEAVREAAGKYVSPESAAFPIVQQALVAGLDEQNMVAAQRVLDTSLNPFGVNSGWDEDYLARSAANTRRVEAIVDDLTAGSNPCFEVPQNLTGGGRLGTRRKNSEYCNSKYKQYQDAILNADIYALGQKVADNRYLFGVDEGDPASLRQAAQFFNYTAEALGYDRSAIADLSLEALTALYNKWQQDVVPNLGVEGSEGVFRQPESTSSVEVQDGVIPVGASQQQNAAITQNDALLDYQEEVNNIVAVERGTYVGDPSSNISIVGLQNVDGARARLQGRNLNVADNVLNYTKLNETSSTTMQSFATVRDDGQAYGAYQFHASTGGLEDFFRVGAQLAPEDITSLLRAFSTYSGIENPNANDFLSAAQNNNNAARQAWQDVATSSESFRNLQTDVAYTVYVEPSMLFATEELGIPEESIPLELKQIIADVAIYNGPNGAQNRLRRAFEQTVQETGVNAATVSEFLQRPRPLGFLPGNRPYTPEQEEFVREFGLNFVDLSYDDETSGRRDRSKVRMNNWSPTLPSAGGRSGPTMTAPVTAGMTEEEMRNAPNVDETLRESGALGERPYGAGVVSPFVSAARAVGEGLQPTASALGDALTITDEERAGNEPWPNNYAAPNNPDALREIFRAIGMNAPTLYNPVGRGPRLPWEDDE